jgi:hypothetical protein
VDSYTKRYAAEEAAHRVCGVKAVANDVEVRHFTNAERNDADIAAAVRALAEPFDSVGQPFDPTLHEAIETIQGDSAEPGKVTRQVLRGWRLSGDLLRPARVIVAARTDDAQ